MGGLGDAGAAGSEGGKGRGHIATVDRSASVLDLFVGYVGGLDLSNDSSTLPTLQHSLQCFM